ncbi:MAG: peptidoglycan editing factor PgeF [Acidobacteria bacterium]|nr:MAG: peptidoglycan editing factor PgeF [Acidobacteriota bacterium]
MFYKASHQVYRVRAFDQFDWLEHGFGTRRSENFWPADRVATLHQVHSDIVMRAGGSSGRIGDGDALIENTPGRLVGVKTADCIPLLLLDPGNRAVAAVHAGWRGTVSRIARKTVKHLEENFSSRAEDLHVAIGPGIGKCCYEVGADVACQFREYDQALSDLAHSAHLDLAEINRKQLIESGVPSEKIYVAGLCTLCHPDDFHSYRRDRDHAGRMLSVIGLR